MFFFNFKKRLLNTGIFEGAIDWHSHILPGVDDGIQNIEDSLAALAYFETIGIKDAWLTPHIMEDMPNTTEELRERFQKLQEAYEGPVKLHLAAENMLDNLFNERFAADDLLPIGPKGDHLLVETSYYQPPIDLHGTLKMIMGKGYTPILAHPERYRYMDDQDYENLYSKGVKLQLNIVSLAGAYGRPAQEKAQTLLLKGYYSFFGSDLHMLPNFQEFIQAKSLKKEIADALLKIQNVIG